MVITVVGTRILLRLYRLPAEADINRQILLFVALSNWSGITLHVLVVKYLCLEFLIHTCNILYVLRYMCTEVCFNLRT